MFLITLIFFIKINSIHGQTSIGDAIESFSPCENHILIMERIIGGPPSKENYWDGYIDLSKDYPKLTEARITLNLNAAATVTVDPEEGRIITSDRGYHLSFFRPNDGYKKIKFRVQGRPNGKFPNIINVELNDLNICKNPQEWRPAILGISNTGTISDASNTKVSDNVSSVVCGQRKVLHEGLITSGFPSNEGDWPWHAALFHLQQNANFKYVCGGTLLNTNTIITAAHCIVDGGHFMIPERILVKLGLHNRLIAGRNVQEFRVFQVIPHEEFGFSDLKNDIALLRLATEVIFTPYVQPICLWPKDEIDFQNVVNDIGIVIGWGLTEKGNEPSEILNQGRMPIVDTFTCLESNRGFFGEILSNNNFCAGFRNGTSVCVGDSGGGMILKRGDLYRIRGIVSLSVIKVNSKICNSDDYVVFTDVAKYLNWIENNIT